MGSSFAPNHIGMPIVPRDAKLDFLTKQGRTARNLVLDRWGRSTVRRSMARAGYPAWEMRWRLSAHRVRTATGAVSIRAGMSRSDGVAQVYEAGSDYVSGFGFVALPIEASSLGRIKSGMTWIRRG
ncbi:hypothetical protein GCM10022236_51630 [Microlunatus ginsengisoli]|jgi:hypothetical protein|uniref:Uncharacterized protein n=1 Tax=Microlunatus ginsengisoli TaxID=363863 RepID=A0ABP7AYL4_9ACTN